MFYNDLPENKKVYIYLNVKIDSFRKKMVPIIFFKLNTLYIRVKIFNANT